MKILVTQESSIYLAGWWTRKGQRYISNWLTIDDRERDWFRQNMATRFGKDWDKTDD